MTVALAFECDDGSRAIEMQVQVEESDGVRAEDCDILKYYDIPRTVEQIRSGGYKVIALQFPDSLLPDASRVQQELKDGLSGQWERVFILGDTSYGSCCADEVAAQHLMADCIVHYGRTCLSATTSIPVIYVFGNAPIEVEDCVKQLKKFALLYIGAESAHLTSILMRYSAVDCFSYNPDTFSTRKEGAVVNRSLMRRFFLVQQAKEAQIFGILMGTLGVSEYLNVVHSLQKLIKQSGRKSYLFVVGKVNVPKLANYAEIDAFVLVACQQNTLMDSKEYYKPIVTPYELQLALSPNEEWDGQYKTGFREVIPALAQTTVDVKAAAGDDEDADKPFFSLVSGTYKTASRDATSNSATYALTANVEPDASTALQAKNERTELTTYRSEAAEFLATREYRGLDPRLGKTPAHAAVEGSTGIARGYIHETEQ
ncbi:hypothetical protein BBO99_00002208 [Phytophthora kernoviae]|uniref:2-(3-amino-3-carboxypropyl)histidine synthase subunit 2 n=1 Tax=Phytophthora kernoviae TaxID=325452 RepID=A0A3R7H319_9STRA|nr:hypothetical protein BBO99_00002208 [Phytophthora kernoviae]